MVTEKDRYRLLFGPYEPPRTRRGAFLACEMRGKVKVGGYSDGPIPWPMKWGTRSIILCGDLVKAVIRESELGVAYHWGVTVKVVRKWRDTLGVTAYTEGTQRLMRLQGLENATPKKMRELAKAARKVTRHPKSLSWRTRMSRLTLMRIRKRGTVNPKLRLWTKQEEKFLGTKSDEKVAAQLGRTTRAVTRRRLALGIKFKNPAYTPWTPEEDRLLGTKSDVELATILDRGERAVEHRRIRLGIPSAMKRAKARKWEAKELRLLGKISDKECARRFKRSICTVRAMRKYLKIKTRSLERRPWTPGEDQLLATGSTDEAARRTGRTALAVAQRRALIGIANPKANRRRWTREEESLLGKTADRKIAKLTGFSIFQIRAKRGRMGILAPEAY